MIVWSNSGIVLEAFELGGPPIWLLGIPNKYLCIIFINFFILYIFCLIASSWCPWALAVAKWLIRPWVIVLALD